MSEILLELFKEEAKINLTVLENGLIEGEQNGLETRDIEPLMRAAHSLKGAARVIGLSPFVEVAHVCEDILVAAQNGQTELVSADYDLLMEAAGHLKAMAEQAGSSFDPWFAENRVPIDMLHENLVRRTKGEPRKDSPDGPKRQAAEEKPAAAPMESSPIDEPEEDSQATMVAQLEWLEAKDPANDPMVDLMKAEVATHSQNLQAKILNAKPDSKLMANLDGIAQEIRGCALLAGVKPIATLASELATVFQSLVKEPGALAEARDWLEQTAQLVCETSAAFGPGFGDWTKAMASRAANVLSNIPKFARRQVAPRPQAVSQPKPEPITNPTPAKAVKSAKESSREAKTHEKFTETAERIVRVNALALERLMGLAGESLLEARWLQAFAQSLLRLKRQQSILRDEVDDLLGLFGQDQVDMDHLRESLQGFRQHLSSSGDTLAERMGAFEEHARQSDDLNSRLYREVILSRMTPFRNGVQAFPKMVRDMTKQLGKQAKIEIRGLDTEVDRDILDKLDAPLTHMIRNSLDHGLESPEERENLGKNPIGTLILEAKHTAGMLVITLSDDGRGVDPERIRQKVLERKLASADMVARLSEAELLEFLFLPGFSTAGKVTEISGRGVGLDVVHSTITSVGGSVRLTSVIGKGITFHMQLPLTLSVIRAVLARISGDPYAFPHHRIDGLMRVPISELRSLQDRQFFVVDGRNVGLVMARQILQVDGEPTVQDELPVILFSSHGQSYALLVDEFVGEQDLAVRPIDARLGKVPYVHASAILDDGSPVLILDVDDLRRGIDRMLDEGRLRRTDAHTVKSLRKKRKKVLVTDDSITVREVQRQLLAGKGYDVQTAVDGMDGMNVAKEESFDLIITDIDMPRMNGIEFVTKIRADATLKDTPVVVVSYKDREEDRLRGLEAGANYYLTKSSFQDDTLLQVVHELIGEPYS
ncbi:MAG: hybrid sensor histidine kinase/response regulator [Gemmataceae bacterium]|nr:hybrid sensor histidine kinase/response regulator [Gemmataceae bacterium]